MHEIKDTYAIAFGFVVSFLNDNQLIYEFSRFLKSDFL